VDVTRPLTQKMSMLFMLCALGVLLLVPAAHAEVRITVTGEKSEPLPIAIPRFSSSNLSDAGLPQKFVQVISADLERSGLFRPLDQGTFTDTLPSLNIQPRFASWRNIDAQVLVQGMVEGQGDGSVRLSFRVWDVFAGRQMLGRAYMTTENNWRRMAHVVADDIYERLTGEKGYFNSRIVYIAESGPAAKRIKRLTIMDQDGYNVRYLTQGEALVLTPRFSPSNQEITYLSYYNDIPRVYLFNIDTGRQELLGNFPGMTFAPRFSPDGNKVVMSMARNGNTEIYEMDLRTRRSTRLTRHPAIDTSPSFSPDGARLVFNSDRGGSQQLYIMDADGGNVQRISFGKGSYATPVWSPRGDLIAFTKMSGGQFYIGVMRPDGSGERLLSQGYLVEGPTWAPNGRVLMFFAQNRPRNGQPTTPVLKSIDLTGYNERIIPTPEGASDPAWSPILQ
jgi:TolB protein